MQFKTKLGLAFLAAGIIPSAIVGAVAYRATTSISEGIGARFEQSSHDLLDKIDRFLFERYGDVQAFAANRTALERASWYDSEKTTPIHEAMNTYASLYGIYDLLVMVDSAGKVVACNQQTPAGKPVQTELVMGHSFRDEGWFKDAMAGAFLSTPSLTGSVVHDPVHDAFLASVTASDGRCMRFAAPVKDGNGAVVGVWCNWMRWDAVEALVDATISVDGKPPKGSTAPRSRSSIAMD